MVVVVLEGQMQRDRRRDDFRLFGKYNDVWLRWDRKYFYHSHSRLLPRDDPLDNTSDFLSLPYTCRRPNTTDLPPYTYSPVTRHVCIHRRQ